MAITLRCLQRNIVLKAEHVSGIQNNITDSLSRLQIKRFLALGPEAEIEPEPVPDHLWDIFMWEFGNLKHEHMTGMCIHYSQFHGIKEQLFPFEARARTRNTNTLFT